jgi:hypothetical protein
MTVTRTCADLVAQEIDAAFSETLLRNARFTSDTELWNSVYGFKQALKARIDALASDPPLVRGSTA